MCRRNWAFFRAYEGWRRQGAALIGRFAAAGCRLLIAGAEVISQHHRMAGMFADAVLRQNILRVDVFRDAPTGTEIPDIPELIFITEVGQIIRVVAPAA